MRLSGRVCCQCGQADERRTTDSSQCGTLRHTNLWDREFRGAQGGGPHPNRSPCRHNTGHASHRSLQSRRSCCGPSTRSPGPGSQGRSQQPWPAERPSLRPATWSRPPLPPAGIAGFCQPARPGGLRDARLGWAPPQCCRCRRAESTPPCANPAGELPTLRLPASAASWQTPEQPS